MAYALNVINQILIKIGDKVVVPKNFDKILVIGLVEMSIQQDAQLNARHIFELLEWIPYNLLRNIKYLAQGGFSTIYDTVWLDGPIYKWDYEKKDWERYVYKLDEQDYKDANNPKIKNPLKSDEKYCSRVVLKSLNDSSNINEDFLNEVRSCIICMIHYNI